MIFALAALWVSVLAAGIAIIRRVYRDIDIAREYHGLLNEPHSHPSFVTSREWLCHLTDDEFFDRVRKRRNYSIAHAVAGVVLVILTPTAAGVITYLFTLL